MAIQKKRALVTGASEGIGRVFSLALHSRGYAITAVARNASRLESLKNELKNDPETKIIAADLSNEAGIQLVCEELERQKYDMLVNNAGFGALGRFEDLPFEQYEKMLTLNIKALTKLSYSFMKSAREGDGLINVSSTLSMLPMPIQTVYSATKAYVTSFTESLWYTAKSKGVRVVNLCPGITATQFNLRAGGKPEDLPKLLTQSPEQVVYEALRQYDKGCGPTRVTGLFNRLGVFMTRILPRVWITLMMGKARQ